jgi:hypothetical protein
MFLYIYKHRIIVSSLVLYLLSLCVGTSTYGNCSMVRVKKRRGRENRVLTDDGGSGGF